MTLSRRDCLRGTAVAVAGAALAGCAPLSQRIPHGDDAIPLPTGDVHPTTRLLNRAGFGPRPGDVARVAAMGHDAYIDRQLSANEPEDLALNLQLARLDVLQVDSIELTDIPKEEVIRQLQQAAILRAVYGRNQLLERLTDFWTNHFNVYALKGDSAFRKGTDESEVIRKNSLGSFPDLLRASSRSPAMLAYLDNPQNLKSHPNENYARELMELHTLGIGGGYTQRDVQEVARCFTGWTIEDRFLRPQGQLRFVPERHDDGAKLVLGHMIPAGGGEKDAELVREILCNHPSTARFICKKLVRYFYGAEDSPFTAQLASIYIKTNGSIPAMVSELLKSPRLAEGPPVLKRPFDLVVSSVRATGGETDGGSDIQGHLAAMGESPYEWPMPDGYPTKASAWTGCMLKRWNFAHAYAHELIANTSAPAQKAGMFELTHGRHATKDDGPLRNAISGKQGADALALCLASPSFQWT